MLTSCFKRAGDQPSAVAISRGLPRIKGGWHGHRFPQLCPTSQSLKLWRDGQITDEQTWAQLYREEILLKLNPAATVKAIEKLAGPDAILLCWEAPGEFCHRRLVAAWIEESLGIKVPEWNWTPIKSGPEKTEAGVLF